MNDVEAIKIALEIIQPDAKDVIAQIFAGLGELKLKVLHEHALTIAGLLNNAVNSTFTATPVNLEPSAATASIVVEAGLSSEALM